MTKKMLKIKGMTCMHCADSVTKALQSLDGVKKATVDLKGQAATVEIDNKVTEAALRSVIEDAGYELLNIKID